MPRQDKNLRIEVSDYTTGMEEAGLSSAHLVPEQAYLIQHSQSSPLNGIDPREFLLPPPLTPGTPQPDRDELEVPQIHEPRSGLPKSPFKHDWESSSNDEEQRFGRIAIHSHGSSSTAESLSSVKKIAMPAAVIHREQGLLSPSKATFHEASSEITRNVSPNFVEGYSRYPSSSPVIRPNSRFNDEPRFHKGCMDPVPSPPPIGRTSTPGTPQMDIEKWSYSNEGLGAVDPFSGGDEAFILYTNEEEDDDKYHMPLGDDDKRYRPKFADYLHMKTLSSLLGGALLVMGIIVIFLVLPFLAIGRRMYHPPPGPGVVVDDSGNYIDYGPAWARVNNRTYPLLQNVRRGLIDEDTPKSAYTRQSTFDKSQLKLVFSDEFNKPNRTFYAGDDPYWTAPDIWYGATQDMEWYDPDAATTANGTLQLKLERFANHGLNFRSGMLNSWNQMCFKGGVFEVSVSLAGPSGVPGLWPGAWSMGNLGRPGYKATTEGVWPYTYNSCDYGITPNQSSPDGLSHLPGQKLSSCTCAGQDHPSPGTGRGAPEIDILEASVDPNNLIGVVTQSAQVAPFDIWYRPNSNFLQIPNYNTTQMNGYCGGPFQQAVSGTTLLNNNWYDDKEYQKYAFEYVPGTDKGKIAWFVGDYQTFMMDGRAIGPNGNVGARVVSEEPMSLILNLGMSGSWSEIRMGQLKFPTIMHIDYVRIYQKAGEEMVTCDPPGYPTTQYIADHPKAYHNPNLTEWDQTGYGWPRNTLMHGCKA